MKLCRIAILITSLILTFGCDREDPQPQLSIFTKDYDFNIGGEGWQAGFADYPANPKDSAAFELKYAYTDPIDSKLEKRSIMLSGKNVNNDLFMYIKTKVVDLQPNTDYTLTFNIELASDLKSIQPANGGAVFLKAGATYTEPKSVIENGLYVMNIDKGNQNLSGEDMISLGDIVAEGTGSAYSLVTRTNTQSNARYIARTNSNGELWLIVGTDSSISGTTKVFFTRINVVFSVS